MLYRPIWIFLKVPWVYVFYIHFSLLNQRHTNRERSEETCVCQTTSDTFVFAFSMIVISIYCCFKESKERICKANNLENININYNTENIVLRLLIAFYTLRNTLILKGANFHMVKYRGFLILNMVNSMSFLNLLLAESQSLSKSASGILEL